VITCGCNAKSGSRHAVRNRLSGSSVRFIATVVVEISENETESTHQQTEERSEGEDIVRDS